MLSKIKLEIQDGSGGYLTSGGYNNPPGHFFYYEMNKGRTGGRAGSFVTCRETLFSNTSEHTKHIGYLMKDLDVLKTNEFFRAIEDPLNRAIPTTIYRTQFKGAIIVYIPPFWRSDPTRRSFFSLFLRCAAGFYKGSMDEALKKYELASMIRPAIDLFLDGNTVPTYKNGVGGGVVSKFAHLGKTDVKSMLRKPKQKKCKE